jgi:putative tryptophan/tyrosine transport system substrate-binding protein
MAAFHQGLREIGFVEGRNVAIEYRWAQGRNDRLRALAAELVRRQVAVIAAAGSSSALAAKAETTTLPIVFSAAVDPVAVGLVASLDRPGGNVTGVTNVSGALLQKQVEMLHELAPTATVLAALLNPTFPGSETQSRDLQAAAHKLGLQLHVAPASTERASTRPLRRWYNCEPVCSLSVPTRSFSVTAIKSPPLPFVTGCPRFSSYASSLRLAA